METKGVAAMQDNQSCAPAEARVKAASKRLTSGWPHDLNWSKMRVGKRPQCTSNPELLLIWDLITHQKVNTTTEESACCLTLLNLSVTDTGKIYFPFQFCIMILWFRQLCGGAFKQYWGGNLLCAWCLPPPNSPKHGNWSTTRLDVFIINPFLMEAFYAYHGIRFSLSPKP